MYNQKIVSIVLPFNSSFVKSKHLLLAYPHRSASPDMAYQLVLLYLYIY